MSIDNATPTPSPEGHDAAMTAAFEAAQNRAQPEAVIETPPATERPAWLPEGFENPEDFRAAYDQLKTPAADPATATPADAQAAAQAAGVDYDAAFTEFSTNGELSAETYGKIEAAGISRAMVDAYIQGQQSIADGIQASIYDSVGGEDTYAAMVKWAATGLSKNEIAAFNRATESGDVDVLKMAVGGLKARYVDANGSEPQLLGGSGGAADSDVFRSRAQLSEAMRDPRYAKDPAYRADVAAKIGRSNIPGF